MGICSVVNCTRCAKDGDYFPLKNKKLCKAWVIRTGRAEETFVATDSSYVCGEHFLESDWEWKDGKRKLKKNVVPQPISFKKEYDTSSRKRKPNPKYPSISESLAKRTRTEREGNAEEMVAENEKLKKENFTLKHNTERLLKIVSKVFNKDQIALLGDRIDFGNEKHSPREWSTETVLEALRLRFICGTSGYAYICTKLPYPNIRTLQRQTEAFKCNEGIQTEILEIMPCKVQRLAENDRHVALVNDEVKISSGLHHDPSVDRTVGLATLPGQKGQATKGMVWLVAGMKLRIKEVVAYHFTTDSVDGKNIWEETTNVISETEKTGLLVDSYITDMAPSNIAVWSHLGIKAQRHGHVVCKIVHPNNNLENSSTRFLYIFSDAIHLYKNLKAGLENNKFITLSSVLVEKYELPSNTIRYEHFEMLMQIDQEDCLKLSPKLAKTTLNPNNYQQMSVHFTKKVINLETATALDFLADEMSMQELKTTSWFTIKVYRWFQLMSSTSVMSALSHRREEKYQEAILNLQEFMFIIRNLYVGESKVWKPWQSGILISTTAVLELQEYYLEKCDFKFFLTSHLTSNCIENVFSVLRLKHKVMNALQFKQDLKQQQLSKFFKPVTTSSYDPEDFVGLTDAFKDFCQAYRKRRGNVQTTPQLTLPNDWHSNTLDDLDNMRLNVLFYVSGIVLGSVQLTFTTCEKCFANVIVPKYVASYTDLVRRREYSDGALIFCSKDCFQFFERMEKLFRAAINCIAAINQQKLIEIFTNDDLLKKFYFPGCHDLKSKIIKRFSLYRLRIELDNLNRLNKKHEAPAAAGSKSVAQIRYTQNPSNGTRKRKNN